MPMPDLGVDNNSSNKDDVLSTLDPIFNTPIGPSPTAKQPSAPKGRQPFLPELGLTPQQEKYAAGAAGAAVGPGVQTLLGAAFPSESTRIAEGVKTLSEQQKLHNLLRNMQEEELLRAGIKPADLAPKSATSGTNWLRNWAGMDKTVAGGVPEGSALYQRTKGQGPVTSRMTKMWGPSPAGEPGAPKEALIDRLMRTSAEAEQAAAAQAKAATGAQAAAASRLTEAIPGPLATLARGVMHPAVQGPLATGAALMSYYEALQKYMEGDRSAAVIDALGGTGAILSMVPGARMLGLGMAVGSPAAHSIQQGLRHPETVRGIQDIQVDPMGAPTGP